MCFLPYLSAGMVAPVPSIHRRGRDVSIPSDSPTRRPLTSRRTRIASYLNALEHFLHPLELIRGRIWAKFGANPHCPVSPVTGSSMPLWRGQMDLSTLYREFVPTCQGSRVSDSTQHHSTMPSLTSSKPQPTRLPRDAYSIVKEHGLHGC